MKIFDRDKKGADDLPGAAKSSESEQAYRPRHHGFRDPMLAPQQDPHRRIQSAFYHPDSPMAALQQRGPHLGSHAAPHTEDEAAVPQRLGTIAQPWVKSVEAAFGSTYADLPVALDEDLAAAGKTACARSGKQIDVASAEVLDDPAVMVHEVAHIAQQRGGLTLGEGAEMERGQGDGVEAALSPTRAVALEEEVEAEGAGDAGAPMAARAQGEVDPNENAAEEQDAAGGQPDLEAEADQAAAAVLGGGIAAEGLVLSPAPQERLYSDLEPAAEGLRSGAAMGASGLPEPLPASERFRRHLEAALQKDLEDYLKKIDTQANEAMAQINAAIAEAKSGPLWANPLTAAKRMSELEALRNGAQKRQAQARADLERQARDALNKMRAASDKLDQIESKSVAHRDAEDLKAKEASRKVLSTAQGNLHLNYQKHSQGFASILAEAFAKGDATPISHDPSRAAEVSRAAASAWESVSRDFEGMASEVARFPMSVQQACMGELIGEYDRISGDLLAIRDRHLANDDASGELSDELKGAATPAKGWLERWKSDHSAVFKASLSEETEKASEEVKQGFAQFEKQEDVHAAQKAWLARLEVAWEVDRDAVLNWVTGQQSKRAEDGLSLAKGSKDVTKLPEAADGLKCVEKLLMLGAAEAKARFEQMRAAMTTDKLKEIPLKSFHRPLKEQVGPWTRKFDKRRTTDAPDVGSSREVFEAFQKKILSHTNHGRAVPGMSRHALGTEFDIGETKNSAFEKGGDYHSHFQWLNVNAWRYGFFRPYQGAEGVDENLRNKYKREKGEFVAIVEERWHWSYYPVAQAFWELVNRHWDKYEARLKTLLKEEFPEEEDRHGIPWQRVSWVHDNLRMLHEGINTKL